MDCLTKPLLELDCCKELLNCIDKNKTPVLATGVSDSQKSHLSYALCKELKRPVLIITYSEPKAREIYEDMRFFLRDNAWHYPSKDIVFYSADVKSMEIVKNRFSCLATLTASSDKSSDFCVVASIEALFDKLVRKDILSLYMFDIKAGDTYPIERLSEKLVFMGYERVDSVEVQGQFAVRGGILDLFAPASENAVRIEFWGDEVDSIRLLDQYSQRSVEKTESATVLPVRELVYGQEQIDAAIERIKEELSKTVLQYEKKGLTEQKNELLRTMGETIERLTEQKSFSGVENYMRFFYDEYSSLLDYLRDDTVIIFDEPSRLRERADNVLNELHENIKSRILKGRMLPSQSDMAFSYADLLNMCGRFSQVLFQSMRYAPQDFKVKAAADFLVKSGGSALINNFDALAGELSLKLKEGARILFLAGPRTRSERIMRELSERDLPIIYYDNPEEAEVKKNVIAVSRGSLNSGFEYCENKFIVLSDKELFGSERVRKVKKKKKAAVIESFTDLKPGDYIVHDNHGVGLFKGIEKITSDGISKDYIKIGYSDDGNLYVPINQMDMVQKYIGGEAAAPKLNKLGGGDWKKAKAKASKAAKILAADLISLYAKRQAARGFVYSKDTLWQKEFEETFPYEETDDQLSAIADVKTDMESYKVMDRLICGDVGYGKTEIALRSAFKAVQDGKQVAYIVPTTILAQQHHNTFTERMQNFPVTVEMLSRFRTPKQQKEIINGMSKGLVDIVIGTHRLLSKDIAFKNLGLIIVDEEQRFGVSHKEKLKRLKGDLDVLTLTATPIPRTLHMSLTGIRDMSLLEEPPNERLPVQTYVMEYNEESVIGAINRELSRDGQVFYLHNRVRNIGEVAAKLQSAVPEARVCFAHGQMSERELENVMIDFLTNKFNVLVCTTIIETGLDIPNVNTIIIQDADRMGLAQLYQLRGRVGRSKRTSFAYLMYRKDKVLQEASEKRLQAIKEFTEFGSGFKVSMRDLEIRGAGNLLGGEQHGHMEAVGYDMYCKLLDMEVKKLKGEPVKEAAEMLIDLSLNAFIPPSFIKNEEQKLELYKKIAAITSEEDYMDICDEIIDRFGEPPKSVQNLLDIAMMKSDAQKIDIISIIQKGANIALSFKPDARLNPERVMNVIKDNAGKLSYTGALSGSYITYKIGEEERVTFIRGLRGVFAELLTAGD